MLPKNALGIEKTDVHDCACTARSRCNPDDLVVASTARCGHYVAAVHVIIKVVRRAAARARKSYSV